MHRVERAVRDERHMGRYSYKFLFILLGRGERERDTEREKLLVFIDILFFTHFCLECDQELLYAGLIPIDVYGFVIIG